MRKVLPFSLLLLSAPAAAQGEEEISAAVRHAQSARALLETCSDGTRGSLSCEAYFAGFQHASAAYQALENQRPLYCFEARPGTRSFTSFIVRYLADHPDVLDYPMGPVVLRALQDEYPCKGR